MIQTWEAHRPETLAGERVGVIGLENTISDALLGLDFVDGLLGFIGLHPPNQKQRSRLLIPVPEWPLPSFSSGSSISYWDMTIFCLYLASS